MNSIEINDELLKEIEELAGAAYTPRQIAFMLGIAPSLFCEFVKDEDSEVSIAFYKGLYSSELSVRKSILSLARNGSSPAQSAANELFKNARKELLKGKYPGLTEEE